MEIMRLVVQVSPTQVGHGKFLLGPIDVTSGSLRYSRSITTLMQPRGRKVPISNQILI